MQTRLGLGLTLAIAVGLGNLSGVRAVELSNGTVHFVQPPLLETAATTRSDVYAARPTYYFTLTVPENAGEPLQRLEIAQRNGSQVTGSVEFDVEETRAFLGTRRDRGSVLSIANTQFDAASRTLAIEFATPVPPGNRVTVGVRAERNPRLGGVYLFGVTAFPAGEQPNGQFLGYGRLQFYERNNGSPWFW